MASEKRYSMVLLVPIIAVLFISFTRGVSWGQQYLPSVHWVFCVDTSGSMKTRGNMDLLREITERIAEEFLDPEKGIIKAGDRITIFSFDETVRLEVTSLYQTNNDLLALKTKLEAMNERRGQLTFISEAIVQALNVSGQYDEFFHTNALYVFTDGKSEPYSPDWPQERVEATKERDRKNLEEISLSGKEHGLNIWLGVLKWQAFEDARKFVAKIGRGAHLVDLTDFNRLSVTKALQDFSNGVRANLRIPGMGDVDFGTIPYNNEDVYEKSLSYALEADTGYRHPDIVGQIIFDPDNPSEIAHRMPLTIRTTAEKMVMKLSLPEPNKIKSGLYKGRLELAPYKGQFGALIIEPSHANVVFEKSGFVGFYAWKAALIVVVGLSLLLVAISVAKRRMPIKV